MNGAPRNRRLQYHAVSKYGFSYVWIDDDLLAEGENPYIAGFRTFEDAVQYGRINGWEVPESSEASRETG